MSLTEQVKQALEADAAKLEKKTDFVRLRDFYAEMQRSGIAQRQAYSLPPLDTVGRRLHQMMPSKAGMKGNK